jgi:predicted nucleotidyltransferase
MTFRVRPERQPALRNLVNAVKDDPALTAAVLAFIQERRDGNLGPFRNEAAALSFLAGRLNAALRPEAIFLFGSRAAGTSRSDSDFDLLVVLEDGANLDPLAAYAPVAGCGLGVDVVSCRLADFQAARDRPGTVAFAAEHRGRLLHARPGGPFRDRYRGRVAGR